jgi:drug/metabolite transporter (DMT)-like permease
VFEELHVDWTANLIVSLAYLVVANSLLAITLLLTMLRRGEASRVSALFFLTPPLAALIAWIVLGEDLPAAAWPGMVLAAVGVALATWTRSAQPSAR